MSFAFSLSRPLLHLIPPERLHHLGLWALRRGLLPPAKKETFPELAVTLWGLSFANPVGLAAGFDKNAYAPDALLRQGFGFVECGTVTPLSQPGNPSPRIFRLSQDRAVINRLGFNNDGLDVFTERFRKRNITLGVAGANIGKNKDATDAVADYVTGLMAVHGMADYITVNISSPNTQGLRDLQHKAALSELLSTLRHARMACEAKEGRRVPLLLKVAPDLSAQEREDVAETVLAQGIDGLIVSNTTLSRPSHLRSAHKGEAGGLSGLPLTTLANESLAHFYRLTQGKLPLVGVGGIASAEDAYRKIRLGASLVQLYTALVYQGFGLVPEVVRGLAQLLAKDGFMQVGDAVGVDAKL
ncbi:MAG: quinone-dependent dihydroorotate dehydrogenase [Rickettsiales bacterium]|nr:quinone-dependent dihydroorotate dehydrogenase [Rickettsiales bacterium]